MAPVIRAAALGDQPRKLASRAMPGAAAAPTPQAASGALSVTNTPDPQAQRERQRQAEAERQAVHQKAAQEGYDAGHAKGLADAQAAYREKLLQLERMLQDAGHTFAVGIGAMEDVAVGIAFEAFTKLLGATLVTPAGVHAMVSEVLKRTKHEEKLVLRLAPQDFYLLLQHRSESQTAWHPSLELVPDERIQLGGCLVETSAGNLDARIETQLAELRRVLIQARAQVRAVGDTG